MILKKLLPVITMLAFAFSTAHAQIYYTKNGHIAFYSRTILENIQADNNQVISILNIQTGEIRFSLLNNAFIFQKAKMEEDFNEHYMESDRYPRSEFSGVIENIGDIDFNKDGKWAVNVSGELTIHGVTRKVSVSGHIQSNNGQISASATFNVAVKDFYIRIPSIVTQKIAERVEVKADCRYQKK